MDPDAYIVNAFADGPARGNPAGVVFHDGTLEDETMLAIASDLGKSETAFVTPGESRGKGKTFGIRWFSPSMEMPLCGHATLAAAKAIHDREPGTGPLLFAYRGGTLAVERKDDDSFVMDFPLDEWSDEPGHPDYARFFGIERIEACIRGTKTGKVILVLPPETELRAIRPDFRAMLASKAPCARGIGLTKRSTRYDCETRYFNPWSGVDEDPVTGSVHTVLARYWGDRLGKTRLLALQDSRRPGILVLETNGDRVRMGGHAYIVMSGRIRTG